MIAGQRVCKAGKGKPCYKLAYFSELRRRLNFMEADLTCRRDGGQLLSIESESEQKVVEQLITELRPADGDFWIGLRRNHGNEDSSSDCSPQYYWADGSKSTFRWVEVCVCGGRGRFSFRQQLYYLLKQQDISFKYVSRKYILGEGITVTFITNTVFLHQGFLCFPQKVLTCSGPRLNVCWSRRRQRFANYVISYKKNILYSI